MDIIRQAVKSGNIGECEGPSIVEDIDPCDPNPCQHGGTCTEKKEGEYECICPDKREG